jgi:chromosomal replication initiator protein
MRQRPTFENFVISSPSRTAAQAAVRVCEEPARAHNPLVLFGPTGSGKTHLLQAIEHAMQSHRVLRLSADDLANRITAASRAAEKFRIGDIDVLLIDDLELMRDEKPNTRRELIRTIDELTASGVQVVVACNAANEDIVHDSFPAAFAAEVAYPDPAARLEIATRAAAAHGIAMTEEMRAIIETSTGNPREIEAAAARAAAAQLSI